MTILPLTLLLLFATLTSAQQMPGVSVRKSAPAFHARDQFGKSERDTESDGGSAQDKASDDTDHVRVDLQLCYGFIGATTNKMSPDTNIGRGTQVGQMFFRGESE